MIEPAGRRLEFFCHHRLLWWRVDPLRNPRIISATVPVPVHRVGGHADGCAASTERRTFFETIVFAHWFDADLASPIPPGAPATKR
jgi:hypothetical protein